MKHILVLILTLAFALAPARADELLPLFDLQSQSGQLWNAIKAHLDAQDAKIATLTAERDALKQRLDAAAAAWAAQDLAKIGQLAAEAAKTEKPVEVHAVIQDTIPPTEYLGNANREMFTSLSALL